MDQNSLIAGIDSLFEAYRNFERFNEPGMISEDYNSARWGWGNWMDVPEPVIIKNDSIWMQPSGYSLDNTTGVVTFNTPLNPGDSLMANYTMRLFPLEFYAMFIPMVMAEINIRKPQTNFSVNDAPDNYLGTVTLGIYLKIAAATLLKLGLFKFRRLFEDPNSVETQLRANLEDGRAQYDAQLATIKRRALIQPQAVASFNVGRQGLWQVDNINFQMYVITR
jgi:hypothetical protein